ncbi:hypothetical protein J6590_068544 [Homalodisca vitripennis]|nr:hypothetical protein J6590_068544 [Homalodisca vitripennis]
MAQENSVWYAINDLQDFNAGIISLMAHILPIIHNAWTAQMIDIAAPNNHYNALRIRANAG